MVLCNPAVEYKVAVFSELSFAARWLERLSKANTTGNSTMKLLTTVVVVDILAEKATSVC